MKRSTVLVLIMVVCLASVLEADESRDRHGWSTIVVKASYSEEFGLAIDEDFHDVGVFGPGDSWTWQFECGDCEDAEWMITDLQLVADMHQVAETLISMFEAGEQRTVAGCDLGLKRSAEKMAVAAQVFNLGPLGRNEWYRVGEEVTLSSRNDVGVHRDELWKFSVEVRFTDWEEFEDREIEDELDRCRANPRRACWDPHNFKHPPSP